MADSLAAHTRLHKILHEVPPPVQNQPLSNLHGAFNYQEKVGASKITSESLKESMKNRIDKQACLVRMFTKTPPSPPLRQGLALLTQLGPAAPVSSLRQLLKEPPPPPLPTGIPREQPGGEAVI